MGGSWNADDRCVLTDTSRLATGFPSSGPAPAYPDPRRLAAGIVFFLALGCLLRIVRYAQNLPLWSDECFLAVNFIRRGYADLLQPLDNGQIAPLLFLWAQRLVVDLVGFSECGLRLFALLCGLASVFLFWRFAGDVLGSRSLSAPAGGRHLRDERASDPPCRRGQTLCIRPLDGSCACLFPPRRWLRGREASGWLWALVGRGARGAACSPIRPYSWRGVSGWACLLPRGKRGAGRAGWPWLASAWPASRCSSCNT